MSEHTIRFELNGTPVTATVPANRTLLDLLRDDLGLTGAKEGCSVGVCGACSVLLDGELLSSCILPAVFVDDRSVTTVEGLATDGRLTSATALLAEVEAPTEATVRQWMMGNLCRCTGYEGIVSSVLAAAEQPG